MTKLDPLSFQGVLAKVGDPKNLADIEAAEAAVAEVLFLRQAAKDEAKAQRATFLQALDGVGVSGIDARIAMLEKDQPDIEALERIIRQRGKDARDAEAVKAAPGLLRALAPLAEKLAKAREAEGTAFRALATAADLCAGTWGSIPRSSLPPRTEDDNALVSRVNVLLGGHEAGRRGYEDMGSPTRFSLPSGPRAPGPVRVITMEKKQASRTFNVRGERGGVG